jgi:hypothetical protein
MDKDILREKLLAALPPLFSRKTASEAIGGLISAGHLANLDSDGCGPPKTYMGRLAAYERDSFVEWVIGRLGDRALERPVPKRRGKGGLNG